MGFNSAFKGLNKSEAVQSVDWIFTTEMPAGR